MFSACIYNPFLYGHSKFLNLPLFNLVTKKLFLKVKVKCSRYRPGVAQRVGISVALLFHGCGTRRG